MHGTWSVKMCNTCQRPVLAHEHPWRSACDREKDILPEALKAEMMDAFNEVFMYSMEVFVLSLQHSTSSMMKSKLEQQPVHQEQQSRPKEL